MGYVIGVTYCLLWYGSILAGYAGLFCPLLPLLFISNRWYRRCIDVVFTFWQVYPTALLQILCSCNIQVSGDPILAGETSILVVNHRTRTDWNFLWPAVYHGTIGSNRLRHPTKFVLKDIIKHVPGPGWTMQLACFLFIKRCWNIDKKRLKDLVAYFCDMTYKFNLLLFPEGTDFTLTTKEISHQFAEKHNLQIYENVLHPRTTGFSFLAYEFMCRGCLDSIYDITLVYCDSIPQTEKSILLGTFPKKVKMHFTRYPLSMLPQTEDGLNDFLKKCWSQKETTLEDFKTGGNFLHGQILRRNDPFELYFALIFWSILPFFVAYAFLAHVYFRYAVLSHTVFLIFVDVFVGGFQDFEIVVHKLRKRVFGKFKIDVD